MLKKISDYLPITSDGIFTSFINPVWAVPFPDTEELDRYFILRYGDRIGSKIIEFYADSTDGTVKGDKLAAMSKMVYDINARKWEHLFGVYEAEYNPIENTDFIETIKDTNQNTRVIDDDTTNTGSATTTSSGTSTDTNNGAGNVYGFNSASAVGDTTTTNSGTSTTSATSTTTSSGSATDDSTITDNGTHDSEHRKHGNIGITSTVELMTGEVEFWKWSFIDQVCKDICDIIALSIY